MHPTPKLTRRALWRTAALTSLATICGCATEERTVAGRLRSRRAGLESLPMSGGVSRRPVSPGRDAFQATFVADAPRATLRFPDGSEHLMRLEPNGTFQLGFELPRAEGSHSTFVFLADMPDLRGRASLTVRASESS